MITNKIEENIRHFFQKGEITEDELLYICQVCFDYLNPTSISEFAKQQRITRQGVYSSKYKDRITNILGKQYVLNNE